jgi:metal transporter CNNM
MRLAYRRHASSAMPTLFSLSKLFALANPRNLKRGAEFAMLASETPDEPEEEPGSPRFWWKLGLSAFLVLAGGVFAG